MWKIDLSKSNSAISILLMMDIIFLALSTILTLGFRPETRALGQRMWEVFMGSNGALFLLLNAAAKKDAGIPNGNGNPTDPGHAPDNQPQQSTK